MPRYQVKSGEVLPVNGRVLEAGTVIDLPRVVAEDVANRHLVQEVDDKGQPVAPVPVDDLERFRAHERVGILRDRLTAAQGIVASIQAQIDHEDQVLADAVKAADAARVPAKPEPLIRAAVAAKE